MRLAGAAQWGKTVFLFLSLVWFIRRFNPVKAGFYFPTGDAVAKLVKDRFDPLFNEFKRAGFITISKGGTDNTELKQIFESSLYFMWMGGSVTKDSTPLDLMVVDEARLVSIMDIEQTEKRLLNSMLKFRRITSTFGFPQDAIDILFRQGNQNQFYTKCPHCGKEQVMWRDFPDNVAEPREGEPYYICMNPSCRKPIEPQDGIWVPEVPSNEVHSYHVHGILAPQRSAKYLLNKYRTAVNMKEFWNSDIGKTYMDTSNVSVTEAEIAQCEDRTQFWEATGQRTVLSVDQMGEFNVVVVSRFIDNNSDRVKLIHLEVIYGEDPFKRVGELMQVYDVSVAVLEQLPNVNDARRFARDWHGRAFVVTYGESSQMIAWHDRGESVSEAATDADVKRLDKYMVTVSRTAALEWSFQKFKRREVVVPVPEMRHRLIRRVRVSDIPMRDKLNIKKNLNDFVPVDLYEDVFKVHMQRLIREEIPQTIKDPKTGMVMETGIKTYRWVKWGIDPHFLFAWMLNCVGQARIRWKPQ